MPRIKAVFASLALCTVFGFAQSNTDAQPGAQPTRPRMVRVSAGVIGGLVDHEAVPDYPDAALRSAVHGFVIFKVLVDETGKIVLSEPVEGDSLLVAASVDALRDFRFRPYLLNGTPLKVESQLGFRFSLKGEGDKAKGHVEYISEIPYRPEFRTGVMNDKGVLVLWPRKVSGIEPQLPTELTGESGSVYLTVVIGEDGKVKDIKVLGGDKEFIGPITDAVKQFVYEPLLVDGKPSVATTQASYHFGSRH